MQRLWDYAAIPQIRAIPRNNEKKGSEDRDCRARRRTQAGWRPSRMTTQPCNSRAAELFSVFLGIALGCRRQASGHQQLRGPQNKAGILLRIGGRGHVLMMQFLDSGSQVLAGLAARYGPAGQMGRQIQPQLAFVAVMVHQTVGKALVMRVSKRVC